MKESKKVKIENIDAEQLDLIFPDESKNEIVVSEVVEAKPIKKEEIAIVSDDEKIKDIHTEIEEAYTNENTYDLYERYRILEEDKKKKALEEELKHQELNSTKKENNSNKKPKNKKPRGKWAKKWRSIEDIFKKDNLR